MPIKIAVLGAGRWGVHLVRNFLAHSQATLVAVVDADRNRLEGLRSRFELNDSVVLATDWSQIRELPGLDAVAIATPAATHYALIADALKQGYHVFTEKPLTLDPTECIELCRLAEQQQRQLFVDHTYLFHPAVERGKAVLATGILGNLRYGYATRTNLGPVRYDVDALWDLAIHDIAIFNTWLGEPPIQVQATGKVWLQEHQIDSPIQNLHDLVWVTLTYKSGFQAVIHLSWLNPDKQRRLAVVGSNGTLIFDEMSASAPLTIQHGNFEFSDEQFIPINQRWEVLDIEAAEPLHKVCDRFLNSVMQNQADAISSGWIGTQLVQILAALTQSLNQGGIAVSVTL